MQTVSVHGDPFTVLDAGSGPPLVFVHGFPLDHRMWRAQTNHFAGRYRVIAPDLRSFGGSVAGAGTVTMEQMADDLAGLLDVLGVGEPVVYCGLSMGGYVGWQFRRKYPDRLRALVLADTRAQADSPAALESRGKMIDHVLRAGTQYVAEPMLPKLFAAASFATLPELIADVERTILSVRVESVVAAIRGLGARPDMTGMLAGIDRPTLVIVGEHDSISPPEEMRAMAAAIPNARFVVIPAAGHMTPMENPVAFNAEVEAFLASLG